MALKAVLESLDEVDATLHGHYVEQELPKVGKRFILNVDEVDNHPKVRGLKVALDTTKADKQRLASEVETFKTRFTGLPDDFNADMYATLVESSKQGGNLQEQLQQARQAAAQQVEARLKPEVERRDGRIKALEANLNKAILGAGLQTALVDVGVDPKLVPAVTAYLQSQGILKLAEENGEFQAVAETELGPVPLKTFVSNWAQSDAGKIYITKPTGGDAAGGSGRKITENPFDTQGGKVKPNLTRIDALIKENPARARSLAQQAGWPESKINW